MKKKFLALGMVLALSFTMLIGCGSNTDKEDYMSDIEEFAELSEMVSEDFEDLDADDYEKMANTVKSAIKKLDVTTPEGKAMKKDFKKLADLIADLAKYTDVEDYTDINLKEFTKLQEDIEELFKTAEEDFEAFVDAAEEAGVDEDNIADITSVFNFGF